MRNSHVLAIRLWVLLTTRLAGIAVFAVGLFLVLKRIAFGAIKPGGWSTVFMAWSDGTGETDDLTAGIGMMPVGALIAGLAGLIASWSVRDPGDACARCGHDGGVSPCSECGRVVGDGASAE